MSQLVNALLVFGLTLLSGVLDARGFIYASRAWPDGVLDLRWALSAVVAFVGGLSCYVVAVRYMQGFGLQGVALQSALWFVVTGVGVAVMDGSIARLAEPHAAGRGRAGGARAGVADRVDVGGGGLSPRNRSRRPPQATESIRALLVRKRMRRAARPGECFRTIRAPPG